MVKTFEQHAEAVTLTEEEQPNEDTVRAFKFGVDEYNFEHAGSDEYLPLWIIGRDKLGVVQAGLYAQSYWRWLHVDWLWVSQAYRRGRLGSKLLARAEAIALERDCVGVYLNTFTFQAPGFYKRHGYTECGRLRGLPPGHDRIWFSKSLSSANVT